MRESIAHGMSQRPRKPAPVDDDLSRVLQIAARLYEILGYDEVMNRLALAGPYAPPRVDPSGGFPRLVGMLATAEEGRP